MLVGSVMSQPRFVGLQSTRCCSEKCWAEGAIWVRLSQSCKATVEQHRRFNSLLQTGHWRIPGSGPKPTFTFRFWTLLQPLEINRFED